MVVVQTRAEFLMALVSVLLSPKFPFQGTTAMATHRIKTAVRYRRSREELLDAFLEGVRTSRVDFALSFVEYVLSRYRGKSDVLRWFQTSCENK